MSTAEIAKVTGITPAAVRKQLERARGMMKELIEKEGLGNV